MAGLYALVAAVGGVLGAAMTHHHGPMVMVPAIFGLANLLPLLTALLMPAPQPALVRKRR